MKILIPLSVDFGPAGGFRVLSQLANHWMDEGHEVSFLVYQHFDKPYYPTKANLIFYDAYGSLVHAKNREFAPVKSLQLRWALRKALDKCEADVVLATQSFSAAPVSKSRIKAKKFYYVQAYEPDFYLEKGLKNRLFLSIAKNSYDYPLNVIANADMYRDYKGIRTEKIVFPGLDSTVFYPKKEKLSHKDKFIFGTVARREKIKGTAYVIEAFQKLRSVYGNKVELHAAFGEPHLSAIDGITVLSPDGDQNLAEFYRSLDVYICAGIFQLEAVHYPVIETMACKTALITTGYYPSSSKNCLLAEPENSDSIVSAAENIIKNPEAAEKRAELALKDIAQFYWKEVSRKMLGYFENTEVAAQ